MRKTIKTRWVLAALAALTLWLSPVAPGAAAMRDTT